MTAYSWFCHRESIIPSLYFTPNTNIIYIAEYEFICRFFGSPLQGSFYVYFVFPELTLRATVGSALQAVYVYLLSPN